MRSGATDLQENGARLGGTGRPLVRSVWGKSGAVGEKGPFSERTLVLSAPEDPIAGREPSRVGSETTQTPCPKSAFCRAAPVYNLLARRLCDRVGPSAFAARHTQCRTSPRSRTHRWREPESNHRSRGRPPSVVISALLRAAFSVAASRAEMSAFRNVDRVPPY